MKQAKRLSAIPDVKRTDTTSDGIDVAPLSARRPTQSLVAIAAYSLGGGCLYAALVSLRTRREMNARRRYSRLLPVRQA